MIRATLAGLALACVCASVARGNATPPPLPDPAPSACFQGYCLVRTYHAYNVDVPAVNAATGEVIPGTHFRCHFPARWRGKPNRAGHFTCGELLPGDPPR